MGMSVNQKVHNCLLLPLLSIPVIHLLMAINGSRFHTPSAVMMMMSSRIETLLKALLLPKPKSKKSFAWKPISLIPKMKSSKMEQKTIVISNKLKKYGSRCPRLKTGGLKPNTSKTNNGVIVCLKRKLILWDVTQILFMNLRLKWNQHLKSKLCNLIILWCHNHQPRLFQIKMVSPNHLLAGLLN